jgi:hypothetical protein
MSIPELPDGWFSNPDILEYQRLENLLPNNGTLCELGVWKGKSLCSIAHIIITKNLKVIAVDTFLGSINNRDSMKEAKLKDIKQEFIINTVEFGINPLILNKTTNEAALLFLNNSIDLVFIDANHNYKDIKQDIENWLPKTKFILAGHDYAPQWPDVIKAVNEKFTPTVNGEIWSIIKNK